MIGFLIEESLLELRDLVGDTPTKVPPEKDDSADLLVRCIVCASDGRKTDKNIVAMRVSAISTVTSFMVVIVTGRNSRPQNQAIASAIKNDVEANFGGMLAARIDWGAS